MKIELTDEQTEALEEAFGSHEELQEGGYYNLVAQVLTGEYEWTLEVAEVTGSKLGALHKLTEMVLHDEDPEKVLLAISFLEEMEDFFDSPQK